MILLKCVRCEDRMGLADCQLTTKSTEGLGADMWFVLLGTI